ncbi:hypothetical protein JCM13664_10200 [Methylothermus subterraneus]
MLFYRASGLEALLRDCLEVRGNEVRIVDAHRLRKERLDALVYNALSQPEESVRYFLCWLIRQAASGCAVYPASLAGWYTKVGRGQAPQCVIPAVNLQDLTYAMGRAAFRAARETGSGALVFSLNGTSPPVDYATCLLAAALREGYEGPVFLEADWLRAESVEDLSSLQERAEEALAAGFFNLLFDPRRLFDLTLPDPTSQVQAAYALCAELAGAVRRSEPKGVGSAIGVRFDGADPDLVPHLRAFVEGFTGEFTRRAGHVPGLSKLELCVRGAADLPGGVDFAEVARREYFLPTGVGLKDASALEEVVETAENLPFAELRLGEWLKERLLAQPQWWDLPQERQEALVAELAAEWAALLKRLKAADTIHLVLASVAIQQTELPRPTEGYHQDAETYYRDILDRLG